MNANVVLINSCRNIKIGKTIIKFKLIRSAFNNVSRP